MSSKFLEGAVIRRYVAAIEKLRQHEERAVRVFASELLDELLEGGSVSDTLRPIVEFPVEKLCPMERLLRFTVNATTREALAKAGA